MRLIAIATLLLHASCGGATDHDTSTPTPTADASASDAQQDAPIAACSSDEVRVELGADTFCIGYREVTRGEYRSFLAAPNQPPAGAACAWNSSYAPEGWPAADNGDGDFPASGVDWCDAAAFCAWRGRRLCGARGGGTSDYAEFASSTDQWFIACTGPAGEPFPYGSSYDPTECNGDAGFGPRPATGGACSGGWPGLLDMSGNVWEWTDSCDDVAGRYDHCRQRGGSFGSSALQLRCDTDFVGRRDDQRPDVGFRCCS